MTRVVCDFLHDAGSARSRNRMRSDQNGALSEFYKSIPWGSNLTVLSRFQ